LGFSTVSCLFLPCLLHSPPPFSSQHRRRELHVMRTFSAGLALPLFDRGILVPFFFLFCKNLFQTAGGAILSDPKRDLYLLPLLQQFPILTMSTAHSEPAFQTLNPFMHFQNNGLSFAPSPSSSLDVAAQYRLSPPTRFAAFLFPIPRNVPNFLATLFRNQCGPPDHAPSPWPLLLILGESPGIFFHSSECSARADPRISLLLRKRYPHSPHSRYAIFASVFLCYPSNSKYHKKR